MGPVRVPLRHTDPAGPTVTSATVRAMEVGQHLMAVVLTVIGVVRAAGDGSALSTAILCGAAVLAWHAVGTVVTSVTRSWRTAVWWLIGLVALWVVAVAISPEFVWLAFLLWLLAGHLLPLVWGLVLSGSVLVVVVLAPILHAGGTTYANVFGPLIGGIFAFGISRGYLQLLRDAAEREHLVTSLTRAQQETADLQDELARAQRQSGAIAERTRLSRDLHDTIAQSISSIRLLAHVGASRSADPEATRTLGQVEALASTSLAEVRRIVAALVPADLEDNALAAALQRMLDRAHDETGLEVALHVDESLPILPTDVEVALLRTASSALANVRLHAGATRAVVSLIDDQEHVRLDIRDDGRGFDAAAWETAPEAAATSYGLRFMRARLRELGGGLDVESSPGEGTALSIHLPIHADPAVTATFRAPTGDRS